MKIDLTFFMNKNRINLKKFCEINNLTSYESLVAYCSEKNFVCVEEKFYSEVFPSKINQSKDETESKKISNVKPKPNPKNPTSAKKRRSSRTSKTRRSGPADKKD